MASLTRLATAQVSLDDLWTTLGLDNFPVSDEFYYGIGLHLLGADKMADITAVKNSYDSYDSYDGLGDFRIILTKLLASPGIPFDYPSLTCSWLEGEGEGDYFSIIAEIYQGMEIIHHSSRDDLFRHLLTRITQHDRLGDFYQATAKIVRDDVAKIHRMMAQEHRGTVERFQEHFVEGGSILLTGSLGILTSEFLLTNLEAIIYLSHGYLNVIGLRDGSLHGHDPELDYLPISYSLRYDQEGYDNLLGVLAYNTGACSLVSLVNF